MKENKPSPEAAAVLVNGAGLELTNDVDAEVNGEEEAGSPVAAAAASAAVAAASPVLSAVPAISAKPRTGKQQIGYT